MNAFLTYEITQKYDQLVQRIEHLLIYEWLTNQAINKKARASTNCTRRFSFSLLAHSSPMRVLCLAINFPLRNYKENNDL